MNGFFCVFFQLDDLNLLWISCHVSRFFIFRDWVSLHSRIWLIKICDCAVLLKPPRTHPNSPGCCCCVQWQGRRNIEILVGRWIKIQLYFLHISLKETIEKWKNITFYKFLWGPVWPHGPICSDGPFSKREGGREMSKLSTKWDLYFSFSIQSNPHKLRKQRRT